MVAVREGVAPRTHQQSDAEVFRQDRLVLAADGWPDALAGIVASGSGAQALVFTGGHNVEMVSTPLGERTLALHAKGTCGSVTHFTRDSRLLNCAGRSQQRDNRAPQILHGFLGCTASARAPIASTPRNRLCWFWLLAGRIGSGRLASERLGASS